MIRPNLRQFAAALTGMLFVTASASMQQGAFAQWNGPPNDNAFRMPQSTYQAPIQDHFLQGDTQLWDERRPIERFVGDVTRHSWLRLEFLMWDYRTDLGPVGAPVTGLQNGTRPFEVEGYDFPLLMTDNLNNGADVGSVLFADASSLSNEDVPGIRGTLGVALNGADLELSFFGFQQANSLYDDPNIARGRIRLGLTEPNLGTDLMPNYAVPLLTDGQPAPASDLNALIFSESLTQTLQTQMWGSEIILLTERRVPGGYGPSLQWLGGFRYINFDETYSLRGTRLDFPGTVTSVRGDAINNYYGPEVGARAAFTTKWLTLSATPRIMFGLNDNTAKLNSVVQSIDGASYNERNIDFGTATQINLAAEVHLTPHFSVFGGYDFLYLSGISRPNNNIVFDSTTDANGTRVVDIRQNVDLENILISGFTIGAVFKY